MLHSNIVNSTKFTKLVIIFIRSHFILVKELVESGIAPHGPFNDSLGQMTGGLMFVKADPDEPSYLGNLAMAKSPAFQNSSPKCILVRMK